MLERSGDRDGDLPLERRRGGERELDLERLLLRRALRAPYERLLLSLDRSLYLSDDRERDLLSRGVCDRERRSDFRPFE